MAASGESSRNGEPGVEQRGDPVARQQLAARDMALARRLGSAEGGLGDPLAQVVGQRLVVVAVGYSVSRGGLEPGAEDGHSPSSRAISMRCTSLVPSPISRIFASRQCRATAYSFMKP